ncbi:MAG TPA: hypothetical protein VMR52_12005 [Dehalococcoidia bacterium]|nr:hypothetical protein [Dehalococcoidia bacterium]
MPLVRILRQAPKEVVRYIPGEVYFELNWDERQEGHPHQGDGFSKWIQTEPSPQLAEGSIPTKLVCLVRAEPFEIDEDIQRAREELNRDRKCSDWFPYQPGRSPSQHLEDRKEKEVETERRRHELQIAEMQSKFSEKALEVESKLLDVESRIADAATSQKTAAWFTVGVSVLAVCVGAVVVFVAAALFEGETTVTVGVPAPTEQSSPETEGSPPEPAP